MSDSPLGRAEPSASAPDCRSALVLVEPIFGPGYVSWHGMAFAGGTVVSDITGADRTVVLDDCLCSLASAGIEFEPGQPDEGITDVDIARGEELARQEGWA